MTHNHQKHKHHSKMKLKTKCYTPALSAINKSPRWQELIVLSKYMRIWMNPLEYGLMVIVGYLTLRKGEGEETVIVLSSSVGFA